MRNQRVKRRLLCALIGTSAVFCVAVGSQMSEAQLGAYGAYGSGGASPLDLEEARLRVELATEALADAETRTAAAAEATERQQAQTVARVRALYRIRRGGALPVSGGFDAMLAHLSRVGRLERLVAAGAERRRALRDERVELEAALEAAEMEKIAAEEALASLQVVQAPTHGLASFFDPVLTPRLPVAQLPERAPSAAPGIAGYGLTLRGRPEVTFAAHRGDLPLPVSGGTIANASREDGSGLEFQTSPGRVVHAVSEGTVAFANHYGVYGNMIIVEHGQSYYTLYAGLRSLSVQRGMRIHPATELGRSGDSPVYFEVRRGTRSLDARLWLGL